MTHADRITAAFRAVAPSDQQAQAVAVIQSLFALHQPKKPVQVKASNVSNKLGLCLTCLLKNMTPESKRTYASLMMRVRRTTSVEHVGSCLAELLLVRLTGSCEGGLDNPLPEVFNEETWDYFWTVRCWIG